MGVNQNLTIVFTDIVNYTAMTSAMSRAEALEMLRRHDDLLLPLVARYRGRRIKSIGDAMLLTFGSPTDAIHCGMAMQDTLAAARLREQDKVPLHIRVAINLGEVLLERRDVFGEPVNIAARLESLTPADEVYFTEGVYLAMNKAEVPSEFVHEQALKGIPEPVRIYRVPTHAVPRLVAAGQKEALPGDLPFGGLHLKAKASNHARPLDQLQQGWVRLRRRADVTRARLGESAADAWTATPVPGRLGLGLAAIALIGAIVFFYHGIGPLSLPPPLAEPGDSTDAAQQRATGSARERPLVLRAEALLADQGPTALRQFLEADQPTADPAELALVRGHLAFAEGRRGDGASAYAQALQRAPDLAHNPRLADNLVGSLGSQTGVTPLLEQYRSETMLAALASRSGQPGYYGRTEAIALLRRLEREDLIDHYGHAIEELKGRSRCEDRLAAVRRLRELGRPEAIPTLKAAMGQGISGWWENLCLRGAASMAIEELRKKQAASG